MRPELVATVHVGLGAGQELDVLRLPDRVALTERAPSLTRQGSGYVLALDAARALVDLLDRALAPGAVGGVLGSVPVWDLLFQARRDLHVIRWSSASVSLRRNVNEHTGYTLRLRDGSEALSAALRDAVGEATTQAAVVPSG